LSAFIIRSNANDEKHCVDHHSSHDDEIKEPLTIINGSAAENKEK
jgi:hypothetical protein